MQKYFFESSIEDHDHKLLLSVSIKDKENVLLGIASVEVIVIHDINLWRSDISHINILNYGKISHMRYVRRALRKWIDKELLKYKEKRKTKLKIALKSINVISSTEIEGVLSPEILKLTYRGSYDYHLKRNDLNKKFYYPVFEKKDMEEIVKVMEIASNNLKSFIKNKISKITIDNKGNIIENS